MSPVAPLANAVIGPVVSVLLAVSIVMVPFSLVAPLRTWALIVPMIAARCALFFEQLFAAVPGASVSVSPDSVWIYLVPCLLAVLLVWWPWGFHAWCSWLRFRTSTGIDSLRLR